MHHLKLPEVCAADGVVLGAHVKNVRNAVVVKIVFAGITSSIPCARSNYSINEINEHHSFKFIIGLDTQKTQTEMMKQK